jgi:Na+-transporting methylmalonyl-CoA/oxaloacetate decarboxylase gamma subunit
MDMQVMEQGLEVTVFGLGGVFAVLILFYCATKIMLSVARRQANKSK